MRVSIFGTQVGIGNADALVICTEWRHFRSSRFDIIKQELKHLVIVDGRNMYDPELIKDKGIIYYGVGRGESVRRGSTEPIVEA